MLRACLLGTLEVELGGTGIDSPVSQRPWALFAYVALAPEPVRRAELANVFWPDVLDQSARASLRNAIWVLRRELGESLYVEGERVGLREPDGVWIDAREFERLAPSDPTQALKLCRGELLEGLEDEWARLARERHRERELELLEELAQRAERRGEEREAIELTRRQVDRDPFDEEAHRRLIARLDAAGDRAGALRTYQALIERLRRELGVAPSARTREVAERLRGGTVAPAGAASPPPPGLLPLVGRDRELAQLERGWRAACDGSGGAALIRGEAGIGKTRLATELRRRALDTGAQTAVSAALDLGGSAPLSLWAELIRELLPRLVPPPADAAWPDDLAVLAAELPAHFERSWIPRAAIAPDLQRTRLFEAVVAIVGWAAREAPLLLVLEDIHSADIPSLELAAYVARRLAGLRVMMLLTRRELPHSPDADRLEHALRARGLVSCELELGPLAAATIAGLARTAADLSDHDVERVVESAEGNALLAVETARALAQGRDEIAQSLRASVRTTLAPLSVDVRRLIELAAVAGRAVDGVEIGQLPIQDPQEAAGRALQTGLLLPAGSGVAFGHALLRDAVYQEIAEPRRPGLHHRWARVLLASEQAGALPRPAEVARQLRLGSADHEAVPELVRAAQAARAVAALKQAAGYLEEALEIAPEHAALWLDLAELQAWRGEREQAERAFTRAHSLLKGADPVQLARAWLRRARAYHSTLCVPRLVLESATAALELLQHTDMPAQVERGEALAAAAWAEAVAGSVDRAERLLAQLTALEREHDDLEVYDIGHARACALTRRGRFADSYGPSIAAGEAVARAGRPDLAYGCWANAAGAAVAVGEHERALEFLQRGMTAIAGHGLEHLEIHLLAARSFVLRSAGRLAQARAAAESEQEMAERLHEPQLIAMANHDRGLVALAEQDHRLAAKLLAHALGEDAPISRPLTRLALAEALARDGPPEEAAQQIRLAVLEPVQPSDFPETLVPRLARVQGLIALSRGEPDEAIKRLEESISGWERVLARADRGDSLSAVLADLGRPVVGLVEPERELAQAREELKEISASIAKGQPDAIVS